MLRVNPDISISEDKVHGAVVSAMRDYVAGRINSKKANKALMGWFNSTPSRKKGKYKSPVKENRLDNNMVQLAENNFMRKKVIRLTESQLRQVIRGSVTRLLREAAEDLSRANDSGDDIRTHYELGFANKFYTLWKVVETKYTTTYIYVKNVSFSKEKAMARHPEAVYNEKLRGRSQTFSVVNRDAGGFSDRTREFLAYTSPRKDDHVSISNYVVTRTGIEYTRYNKPYYSVMGYDVDSPYGGEVVMNIFDKSSVDALPSAGDILKVEGVVGFYNNKTDRIYLNDISFSFVQRKGDGMEPEGDAPLKLSGQRVVVTKVVPPEIRGNNLVKNGFVVVTDEDGRDYVFDTVVSDYMTGSIKCKFAEIPFRGDVLNISGSVIDSGDGFKKLQRVKFDIVERTDKLDDDKEGEMRVSSIRGKESVHDKKGNVISSNVYQFDTASVADFFDYIIEVMDKYDMTAKVEGFLGVCDINSDITAESLMETFNKNLDRIRSEMSDGQWVIMRVMLKQPETGDLIIYEVTGVFLRERG